MRSEKEQWKTVAGQIKEVREKFSNKTPLGKRRTTFADAPEHDEAAIEEAMVVREPITVVVSEKGWIRALRGHQTDLSGVAFKTDDALKFAFPAETTSKILAFATNGRFYTLDASKLPGGRGHGEPVRLFIELEQNDDVVSVFPFHSGRKFIVASTTGRGFVVPEADCLANTRKGKQVLNLKPGEKAAAINTVEGELVASIGENRKMVVFPIEQVPEMSRGAGVRLQRYKDGSLSDVTTFKAGDGLTWIDSAGPQLHDVDEGIVRLARQPRRRRPARAQGLPEEQPFRPAAGRQERRRGGEVDALFALRRDCGGIVAVASAQAACLRPTAGSVAEGRLTRQHRHAPTSCNSRPSSCGFVRMRALKAAAIRQRRARQPHSCVRDDEPCESGCVACGQAGSCDRRTVLRAHRAPSRPIVCGSAV